MSFGEDEAAFIERRTGVVERRIGVPDRRSTVALGTYLDRVFVEIDRRLAVLEHHDERIRDRQGDYLSRERYEERHAQLEHSIEAVDRSKADSDDVAARLAVLGRRAGALEKTADAQAAVAKSRDRSRQRMIAVAGAAGAFASVAMTLILHALKVV
jgi:hypothetical protein